MTQTLYDHQTIEAKWQEAWEKHQLFQNTHLGENGFSDNAAEGGVAYEGDPLYLLFAFAYPSGSGLHVGHVESKTALDILARYYRMNGRQVFFPVGWDAFGLPAENYAIKTGVPPTETTKQAIETFQRQIKRVGISYDWANELATCNPDYYQWTQWIFIQLFNKGLAYQHEAPVNWCPSCQTVLANEQVVNGECERCGHEVIQKNMKQWFFKITQYQDELISGLDQVDWPKPTKDQQLNWIGKKSGIDITYKIDLPAKTKLTTKTITCFTTRPDTNFGATFIVLAPEHTFAQELGQSNKEVQAYIDAAASKTELERQSEGRSKSGVFTGHFAVNQLTGAKMPIWVSDFVLGGFGTGAVVGVPGHDLRDFEFARYVKAEIENKNVPAAGAIEVIRVVVGPDGDDSPITKPSQVQEEAGTMVNSNFLDGLEIHEATIKIMEYLEEKGWGKRVTTYRLRDWLISRQRYWGAPIPIVYDPDGKAHPVKEEHLPWLLPEDVEFKPTGESPLTHSKEFQARVEKLYGKGWRPEYDTMDTFVDSSWYFMRYIDSKNETAFASQEQLSKWLPVDFYMIGPEHIVLHLLYSRFFTKFLRDEGHLEFDEPFMKMRHQGMIMGPDGRKMSKSKGNVINPDDVVEKFGADTLRVYEMFMGPIEADKPWDVSAVAGVYRFLNRIYSLVSRELERISDNGQASTSDEISVVVRKLHQTLAKVSSDIPKLKFNTAIAAMMEFVNTWEESLKKDGSGLSRTDLLSTCQMLAPFTPFLAEELFQTVMMSAPSSSDASTDQSRMEKSGISSNLDQAGKTKNPKPETPFFRSGKNDETQASISVHRTAWPRFDDELAAESEVVLPVQINGKVRSKVTVSSDLVDDNAAVLEKVKSDPVVKKWIKGKSISKEIYVPGKIVNLLLK